MIWWSVPSAAPLDPITTPPLFAHDHRDAGYAIAHDHRDHRDASAHDHRDHTDHRDAGGYASTVAAAGCIACITMSSTCSLQSSPAASNPPPLAPTHHRPTGGPGRNQPPLCWPSSPTPNPHLPPSPHAKRPRLCPLPHAPPPPHPAPPQDDPALSVSPDGRPEYRLELLTPPDLVGLAALGGRPSITALSNSTIVMGGWVSRSHVAAPPCPPSGASRASQPASQLPRAVRVIGAAAGRY